MKRLARALLLLVLVARLAMAGLNAGTVWEVQPTSGADVNGGGYDASIGSCGTDQTSPTTTVTSFTDLAATSASTTITSVAGGFTGKRCNLLHINTTGTGAHCVTGWYALTTVTDNNTATLDRTPTTGGNCAAGQGKIGGAVATITTGTASAVAGNTIHVKNEAWNEAVSVVSGAAGAPVTVQGYNTSRGDLESVYDCTNCPHNNRASGAGNGFVPGAENIIKHIWVSNAGSAGFSLTATAIALIGCKTSSNGTSGVVASNGAALIGLESASNTTLGVNITGGTSVYIVGSYIHNNTTDGIGVTATHPSIVGSIITGNSGHGITATTGRPLVYGNTIHSNSGSNKDGIIFTTPSVSGVVMNNTLTSNNRYGVNSTTGNGVWADANDYNGNGTAARNGGIMTGTHDITSAPSYTATGSANYKPAAGSPLINAGSPGTLPGNGSVSRLDIGAVQSGIGGISQRATGCVQ